MELRTPRHAIPDAESKALGLDFSSASNSPKSLSPAQSSHTDILTHALLSEVEWVCEERRAVIGGAGGTGGRVCRIASISGVEERELALDLAILGSEHVDFFTYAHFKQIHHGEFLSNTSRKLPEIRILKNQLTRAQSHSTHDEKLGTYSPTVAPAHPYYTDGRVIVLGAPRGAPRGNHQLSNMGVPSSAGSKFQGLLYTLILGLDIWPGPSPFMVRGRGGRRGPEGVPDDAVKGVF
ncbi:hypothetical protein QAD02_011198 [Eretmocerus hayati]|uniref:Uncharacterized protein n=1 Tax=Eretmocerus hayati TaxID=131215 RepID=A0ACC2NWD3_9HYME|nr:hypothetical protein QAD02_011198 [Eretmocerus hayati]